jgi:hypothetical protein
MPTALPHVAKIAMPADGRSEASPSYLTLLDVPTASQGVFVIAYFTVDSRGRSLLAMLLIRLFLGSWQGLASHSTFRRLHLHKAINSLLQYGLKCVNYCSGVSAELLETQDPG